MHKEDEDETREALHTGRISIIGKNKQWQSKGQTSLDTL